MDVKKNLENPSTTKVRERKRSSFKSIEKNHTGVDISSKNFLSSYESKQWRQLILKRKQ